jgi:hypothetical protein
MKYIDLSRLFGVRKRSEWIEKSLSFCIANKRKRPTETPHSRRFLTLPSKKLFYNNLYLITD